MSFAALKRLLPDRRLPLLVLRGPFRGAKFVTNPRDNLRKIFGIYEHELNSWLEQSLRRVDRVLDVGANDGYFTFGCAAAFRRMGKTGEIISFEPQAQHAETLRKSAAALEGVSLKIVQALVGREARNGATTLDALPVRDRRDTLIKIDVEGVELDVMAGALSWLNESNLFVIEVHDPRFIEPLKSVFAECGQRLILRKQQPVFLLGRELRNEQDCWLTTDLSPTTVSAGQYVCAFRGRRDSYQVPLALAEGDLLNQFVTDAYALGPLKAVSKIVPRTLRTKIMSRSVTGVPQNRVRCLWGTTLLEHARHALGFAPMLTYAKLDRRFSLAAARLARKNRSNLFLYSPYAWEAFTASYAHAPRKVLFQYHPHPETERRILAEDSRSYPGVGESFSGTKFGQAPEKFRGRERDAWKHADLIFCASSFTKRSLVDVGCDEERCRVVPYGVELPSAAEIEPPSDSFHALFVGSGGQRKGLHHLLLAWQNAGLPASSKLTLVCRVIDRGIEQILSNTPRVELRRNVNHAELDKLYSITSLFVMPSLVEGFGQVYLEALARGCPVLGTANTGLPDLGAEADGIFLVTPGNVELLTNAIELLAGSLPGNKRIRTLARRVAENSSWLAFRKKIRDSLVS